MKVLSYEPDIDVFFVGATWDEYRDLDAKYEIDSQGMGASVEEVMDGLREFLEDQKESDSEKFSYQQYIKDLYDIDDMPNVCLLIKRDLSNFKIELYDTPFCHMWNGYSP